MYVGPWQEYELAQVAQDGGAKFLEELKQSWLKQVREEMGGGGGSVGAGGLKDATVAASRATASLVGRSGGRVALPVGLGRRRGRNGLQLRQSARQWSARSSGRSSYVHTPSSVRSAPLEGAGLGDTPLHATPRSPISSLSLAGAHAIDSSPRWGALRREDDEEERGRRRGGGKEGGRKRGVESSGRYSSSRSTSSTTPTPSQVSHIPPAWTSSSSTISAPSSPSHRGLGSGSGGGVGGEKAVSVASSTTTSASWTDSPTHTTPKLKRPYELQKAEEERRWRKEKVIEDERERGREQSALPLWLRKAPPSFVGRKKHTEEKGYRRKPPIPIATTTSTTTGSFSSSSSSSHPSSSNFLPAAAEALGAKLKTRYDDHGRRRRVMDFGNGRVIDVEDELQKDEMRKGGGGSGGARKEVVRRKKETGVADLTKVQRMAALYREGARREISGRKKGGSVEEYEGGGSDDGSGSIGRWPSSRGSDGIGSIPGPPPISRIRSSPLASTTTPSPPRQHSSPTHLHHTQSLPPDALLALLAEQAHRQAELAQQLEAQVTSTTPSAESPPPKPTKPTKPTTTTKPTTSTSHPPSSPPTTTSKPAPLPSSSSITDYLRFAATKPPPPIDQNEVDELLQWTEELG